MANREIDEHLDGQTVWGPRSHTSTLVCTRNGHGRAGEGSHQQLRAVSTGKPATEDRVEAWFDVRVCRKWLSVCPTRALRQS